MCKLPLASQCACLLRESIRIHSGRQVGIEAGLGLMVESLGIGYQKEECQQNAGACVQRCRECGYRILYKKRTRRVVQFEAR